MGLGNCFEIDSAARDRERRCFCVRFRMWDCRMVVFCESFDFGISEDTFVYAKFRLWDLSREELYHAAVGGGGGGGGGSAIYGLYRYVPL